MTHLIQYNKLLAVYLHWIYALELVTIIILVMKNKTIFKTFIYRPLIPM